MLKEIPEKVLQKVKLVELMVRKKVNHLFVGEYQSAFKGQGMTFSEFREYVPGDDVRTISWTLTARTGKTHIKKFDEERELALMLVVDISASTLFGSAQYRKAEAMVHVAAVLAFAAIANKDQVGLVLVSDRVEHFVPPGKGRGHVLRILRDLFYFKPEGKTTNLNPAVEFCAGFLKKKSQIFILSDFLQLPQDNALRRLARKHEVIAVAFTDDFERAWPKLGLFEVFNAETGETILFDSSAANVPTVLTKFEDARLQERRKYLRLLGVEAVEVNTKEDVVDPLLRYFRRKQGRRA